MPMRHISIPSPATLHDPLTKEALKDTEGRPQVWTFAMLLNKLMSNPKWAETYAGMRAQASIEDAFADARDGVMSLAEDDWMKLKEAAETPRTVLITAMGPQTMMGFGLHPMLSRQLLPLLQPIIEASTERPKKPE